jgi:ABC-type multidrug transport system fused ATPase/permease subunit
MHTPEQTFSLKSIIKGIKDILKYAKEDKTKLRLVFILIIISSLVDAVGPYMWGKVIDSINERATVTIFNVAFLEAFAILFVYFVLLIIQSFADLKKGLEGRWIEENVRTSFLSRSFGYLFKLPLAFHKSVKAGETTEKIHRASRGISDIFSHAILESLPQLATALIMFLFVAFTNVYMGIVVGIALIWYIHFSAIEIAPTVALQRQVNRLYAKGNGIVQDAISNIRSIKDFNTEEYEYQKIKTTYKDEAMATWYKQVRIHRHTGAMQNRIRIGVRAAVLVISIYLISRGDMTVGEMLAYNTYALMIFNPLGQIINNWKTLQNGIIAHEEAQTVLAMPLENYVPEDADDTPIEGKVEFKNVEFYYNKEAPVLKNITFTVEKGETIALVGESGVGKSTLIDLLSGFHFAKEGEVCIDGKSIKGINLNILRQNIAVVSQEISLFNDNIKNNIAYGNFDKTDEEIEEAARKAHCTNFIEKFPETWNQVVGEKGLKLSVGQKQRVAIARAILKNPKILILDEPTSALDAGSERIITDSFRELMKGRTTFVIAHRLSTVREADTILVFKNGEIVERGRHEELIKIERGEYRRLYELQIGLYN